MNNNSNSEQANLNLPVNPQGLASQQAVDTSNLDNQTLANNTEDGVVKAKQARNKELIIQQLTKTPIVEVACKKVGVSRASYYRWLKDDPEFKEESEKALMDGKKLINDLAESQLISAIQEGNISAMTYWLKHHHDDYKTRVEITGKLKTDNAQALSQEQEKALNEAMIYAENIMTNFDNSGIVSNSENSVSSANGENHELLVTPEHTLTGSADSSSLTSSNA